MSTTIETLFKITAAVVGSNALKDLADNINKASGAGKNLQRSLNQGAMALKAFAYSEAVQGLKRIVTSAIDLGAELNDVSQKTGISVQTLGNLKGAGDEAGVALDQIAGAVGKLNKNLIEAQDRTSKQAAAFDFLGIKTTDAEGRLRKSEDILYDIADRFKNAEDGAGKTTLAMDLMGKGGAAMIPMLNKGSEAIKELGIAVGPEFTQQASEFNDNLARIGTQFDQLSVDVASQLLPGLISISEGFQKNNLAVRGLVQLVKFCETVFVGFMATGTLVTNTVGRYFADLTIQADGFLQTMQAIANLDFGMLDDIGRNIEERRKQATQEANRDLAEKLAGYRKMTQNIILGNPGSGIAAGTGSAAPGGDKTDLNGYAGSNAANAAKEYEKAAKAAEEWLVKQRESLITLRQEAEYIGLTTVEINKMKDAREFEADVAEKSRKMSAADAAAFKAKAAAIAAARQEVIQYNYEQSRTFGAGAQEFFTKYSETVTDSASQIKNALTNAFKGAEDALVEFTMTGKASFKDFARSIVEDLVRIQIQRSITGPLSNILSSLIPSFAGVGGGGIANPNIAGTSYMLANGGVMSAAGLMPLKTYSRGGIANSPQVAIYGEGRQPEAYVPLPDGRRIPVAMSGAGAGVGDVSVAVTVNNNGSSSSNVMADAARGEALGRGIAAAIKAQIVEEQRPGGLLAQA